jgi:hypothetical protein
MRSVVPLHQIEQQDGFKAHDWRGIDFATARLALGAQFGRDMIYGAWFASAEAMVGYPMVNVRGPAERDLRRQGHFPSTRR